MSVIWSNWPGLDDWSNYMENEYIKNDIRKGFVEGVRLANLPPED